MHNAVLAALLSLVLCPHRWLLQHVQRRLATCAKCTLYTLTQTCVKLSSSLLRASVERPLSMEFDPGIVVAKEQLLPRNVTYY